MKTENLIYKKALLTMKAEEFVKSGKRFNTICVIPDIKKSREVGTLSLFFWLDDNGVLNNSISYYNINDSELEKMWVDCVYAALDKFNGVKVYFDKLFTADDMDLLCGGKELPSDLFSEDAIEAIRREPMVYAF